MGKSQKNRLKRLAEMSVAQQPGIFTYMRNKLKQRANYIKEHGYEG